MDYWSGPLGLGNCNVELKGINGPIKNVVYTPWSHGFALEGLAGLI